MLININCMDSNKHNQPLPTYYHLQRIFSMHSYQTNSLISKQKLSQVLNAQSKKVLKRNLNQPIIDEIWQQAQTSTKGEASVNTIIEIMLEAMDILRKRIKQIKGSEDDGQDGLLQRKKRQLEQKKIQLQEYEGYYTDNPSKVNKLRKQVIELEFEENELENDVGMFEEQYKTLATLCTGPVIEDKKSVENRSNNISKGEISEKPNPYLSSYNPNKIQQKNSTSFLTIFHLTNVLSVLQFIISTFRLPMLPILFYFHSYYIIFFGFQNNNSLIFFIAQGIISVVFDIIYLILRLGNTVQLMPIIHTSNNTYAIVCYVFMVITIILRGILLFFYSRYLKEQSRKTRDYFNLMGHKIYLNHGNEYQKMIFHQQNRMSQLEN